MNPISVFPLVKNTHRSIVSTFVLFTLFMVATAQNAVSAKEIEMTMSGWSIPASSLGMLRPEARDNSLTLFIHELNYLGGYVCTHTANAPPGTYTSFDFAPPRYLQGFYEVRVSRAVRCYSEDSGHSPLSIVAKLTCPNITDWEIVHRPEFSVPYRCKPTKYYVILPEDLKNEKNDCGTSCSNSPYPINLATGNKFLTENDTKNRQDPFAINFIRNYNSRGSRNGEIGALWHHEYNASIQPWQNPEVSYPPPPDANASQLYNSPENACRLGWNEIKHLSEHPQAGQSQGFYDENTGQCLARLPDRTVIQVVPVYDNSGSPGQVASDDGSYLIIRSSGQEIRFEQTETGWTNDAFTKATLDVLYDSDNLLSGYRYTLTNDTVEEYDANGRLSKIERLNGLVETLSYDVSGRLVGVENNAGRFLQFSYANNRIVAVTDQANRNWRYQYSADGKLLNVIYPDGTPMDDSDNPVRKYHYEDSRFSAFITGISDERGVRYSTYAYNQDGLAVLSTLADNANRLEVEYVDDNIRETTNSRGVRYKLTIGAAKTMPYIAITETPDGYILSLRDTLYNLASYTEFGHRTQWGGHDVNGNPGFMIEAAGTAQQRRTDYTYDPRFRSRVATMSEPSVFPGSTKVTQYSYDNVGNRTQIHVSGYDPYGNPLSRTVNFQYNGPFHQLSQIDGPRIDVDDVTSIDYYSLLDSNPDNRARISRITNTVGIVVRDNMQYSATGKLLSEQRPNGVTVTYSYYPGNDRLQTMSENANGESRTTAWTYLDTGEVASITLAQGSPDATTVRFEYDNARRLTRIIDSSGDSIDYTLDTEGNRVEEKVYDANGTLSSTLSRTFDIYNRLDLEILPASTTDSDFAPDGTLTRFTDGNNEVTQYDYDGLKRLTTVVQPGNIESLYDYNVMDQITTVTDPNGNATQYSVDDFGNVVTLLSPDTADTAYTYDEAGNILQKVDALQQVTTYDYDAANRLIQVNHHDGRVETYTYDTSANGVGRLHQITDASGQTTFSYNGFGDIIEKASRTDITQPDGTIQSVNLTTGYGYNALGLVNRITYPSGASVDYGYDFGRITSVVVNGQVLLDNVQYHATGQVQQWTWANGSIYQRSYDLNGRIINHTDGQGSKALGYDSNHNITDIDTSSDNRSYGYDALNRLTSYDSASQATGYAYDANGNRIQLVDNLAVTDYQIDSTSNHLLTSNGAVVKTYSHDANGNTLSDGTLTFQYDSDNRLVTLDNGDTARYQYNALGQRVYKQAIGNPADLNGDGIINSQDIKAANAQNAQVDCNGDGNPGNSDQGNGKSHGKGNAHGQDVSCIANQIGGNANSPKVQDFASNGGNIALYFMYNEQGQLVGEYNTDAQAQQETIYLNAIPVATVQQGMVYTVQTDHLNTPRIITDSSNTVVWRWDGEPFGNTAANEDPDGDGMALSFNLRFAGQYYDAESGLHYNYFRYYDPGTGRYVTSDPIGLNGGLNTYGYVDANPLRWRDPLGLAPGDRFRNVRDAAKDAWTYIRQKYGDSRKREAYLEFYTYFTKDKNGCVTYGEPASLGETGGTPAPLPENAVGEFHSHTQVPLPDGHDSTKPSPDDLTRGEDIRKDIPSYEAYMGHINESGVPILTPY